MDTGQNTFQYLGARVLKEVLQWRLGKGTSQIGTNPVISLTLWTLQGRGWQDFPDFRGTSPSLKIGKRRQGLPEFRGTHPLWVDDALKGMGA